MAIRERYASSAGAGAHDGSSEANAWSFAEMITSASTGTPAAGDRINFKGNHTLAATSSFNYAGTATSPIILRGYASTPGDGYQGRTNGNGPLVTTNMPTFTCGSSRFGVPAFFILESLNIASAYSGNAVYSGDGSVAVVRCKVANSSTYTGSAGIGVSGYSNIFDSDVELSSASGGGAAIDATTNTRVIGCRVKGGTAVGVKLSAGCVVSGCTIYSSASYGVFINTTTNSVTLLNSTIASGTTNGIHQITGATAVNACIVGCLIVDNGGYGINAVDAGCAIFSASNRLDRNTSGQTSGATDWLAATGYSNDATSATQANEFVDAGSGDYRLKSSSPALSIGLPLYRDIGALQRVRDYPDPSHVTSDDTVDGVTGTYAGGGGGIWMPRARTVGV